METPSYPFEEFLEHFEAQKHFLAYESVTRRGEEMDLLPIDTDDEEGRFFRSLLQTNDYFSQCYSDDRERAFKKGRFVLIMSYLAEHMNEFDHGQLAVHGENGSLVDEALLRAIHEQFVTSDLENLDATLTTESVVERAAEIAREAKEREKDD